MPRPITTLQRPDLSTIAFEHMTEASERGFIGLEVMPVFPTPRQSGDYPKIPIESLLKIPDTSRGARGNYNRSDYKFETGTYSCNEHGVEEKIDDVEAALYNRYFDVEEVATIRAVDIILRSQEARIAAAVFNTTNIPNTAAVTTEWSTPATATPLADVTTGKRNMRNTKGLIPNAGVCSLKVFENTLLTAEIRDALKYTNPIEMGGFEAQRKALASYLGLEKILVGGAIKDGSDKGQDAVVADLWDDEYFGLFKLSNGGFDLKDPCLGRSFLWTEDSPDNTVVETYREEQTRSDIVRVRHNIDNGAFVFDGAGYLLSNITAP